MSDFKVVRAMGKRSKGSNIEYLVLFEGYGSEYAEWLPSSEIGEGVKRYGQRCPPQSTDNHIICHSDHLRFKYREYCGRYRFLTQPENRRDFNCARPRVNVQTKMELAEKMINELTASMKQKFKGYAMIFVSS